MGGLDLEGLEGDGDFLDARLGCDGGLKRDSSLLSSSRVASELVSGASSLKLRFSFRSRLMVFSLDASFFLSESIAAVLPLLRRSVTKISF